MAQSTFSVRMDATLKRQFDALCEECEKERSHLKFRHLIA